MTVRRLLVGALSAAMFLGMFAAGSDASAEMRKKGKGGAGICVSKPMPDCNLFLKAVCEKKSKCGGCLKWVCKP
jgi:hypothetical protein